MAFESAFVIKGGLSNVTDVDDVALLEHVAAITDGHQLHLAIAHVAGHEVGEELHVVDVQPAIQIRHTVRGGVSMMVPPRRQRRTGQCQASACGGSQELAPRWMDGSFPRVSALYRLGIWCFLPRSLVHVFWSLVFKTQGLTLLVLR